MTFAPTQTAKNSALAKAVTGTLAATPTAGNYLTVWIWSNDSANPAMTSVKDGNGVALTQVAVASATAGGNGQLWLYQYQVPATPSKTVTATTGSINNTDLGIIVTEWPGSANATPGLTGTVRASATKVGSTSTYTAPAVTAGAGDVALAGYGDNGNSDTVALANGFAWENQAYNTQSTFDLVSAYLDESTAGTVATPFSLSGGGTGWGSIIAAFEATTAPSGVSASGTGTLTLSGTATATVTTTAAGSGTLTLSGSGTATTTAAGGGTGTMALGGSGTATVTTTAAGSGTLALGGTGTATNTSSAAGTGTMAFAGSDTGTITVTVSAAAGTLTFSGTGTSGAVTNASGTGALSLSGTGTATNLNPASGTGSLALGGTGTAAGTVTTGGTGTMAFAGSGTAAGTTTAGGSGTLALGGAATANVTVTASGTGTMTLTASGTAQAISNAAGSGAISFAAAATATVKTTTAGSGTLALAGTGNVTGTGIYTPGDLTITDRARWGITLTDRARWGITLGAAMQPYIEGDLAEWTATFTDPDNNSAPVDPTTVAFYYQVSSPTGATLKTQTLTYTGATTPAPGTIARTGTGVYIIQVDTSSLPGYWTVEAKSTGTGQAATLDNGKVTPAPI